MVKPRHEDGIPACSTVSLGTVQTDTTHGVSSELENFQQTNPKHAEQVESFADHEQGTGGGGV